MNTKPEAPKAPVVPPAAATVAAKLRAATKAGAGFYDPAVRKLRAELADALKAALLEEHFAAQVSHLNTSPMHCTRRRTALFEAHHSALGGLCLMWLRLQHSVDLMLTWPACRGRAWSRRSGRWYTTARSRSSGAASAWPPTPATAAASRCARWASPRTVFCKCRALQGAIVQLAHGPTVLAWAL